MISAQQALKNLIVGNRRFVSGHSKCSTELIERRHQLTGGQEPFAVILGCSDSRVPVEIVFDQGLGSLFVIRVAGNIVAPSQVGSIEFAAEQFGTRLVVVLGHSRCGAVIATLNELRNPTGIESRNLFSIVDRIRPSVASLLTGSSSTDAVANDENALVQQAVRANIRRSVEELRHGSRVIEQLITNENLLVIGAEYSLETGVVEFLDAVPEVVDDDSKLLANG